MSGIPIGANVDTVTAGTTTNGVNGLFALGTEFTDKDGNTYRYCQAGAAISTTVTEQVAIGLDEGDQATVLTGATALDGYMIGFAPGVVLADNALFWARMGGSFSIRVADGAPADALLGFPSTTTGRLDTAPITASATNVVILGVTITLIGSTSASAGNTVRTAIVRHPLAKAPGL